MSHTDDSLPSEIAQAKEASASARNAARPRSLADRLLSRFFPKRERRIQRTLDAVDALIDHVVAARSELDRRMINSSEHVAQMLRDSVEITSCKIQESAATNDRALGGLKQELIVAFNGMAARTDASQSRLVDLERIVRDQLATREALAELQQRCESNLAQLHTTSAALRADTDIDSRRITHLEETIRDRTATRAALQKLQGDLESSLREAWDATAALRQDGNNITQRLNAVERQATGQLATRDALQALRMDFESSLRDALAATATLSYDRERLAERVDSVERQATEALATRSALKSIHDALEHKLANVASTLDARNGIHSEQYTRLEQANLAARAALAEIQARQELARAEHASLKEVQSRLEQAVGILATNARSAAHPAPHATEAVFESIIERESVQTSRIDRLETVIEEIGATLDHADGIRTDSSAFARFYLAFENRYRGSESEIAERLRVFLPRLAAAPTPATGSDKPLVIDLGCGRGEWLQVVGTEGVEALGIDTNIEMLEVCRRKGLKVIESDALTFLRAQPTASASCVTAFHLIEHVPFPTLLALFRECFRVVTPGGLVIFETPSCHNVLVGSSNFYSDPTHRRPLPSTLTSFALEYLGFASVEVLFLHPYPDRILIPGHDDLASRFNEYFYGAQDYALIAQRPTAV